MSKKNLYVLLSVFLGVLAYVYYAISIDRYYVEYLNWKNMGKMYYHDSLPYVSHISLKYPTEDSFEHGMFHVFSDDIAEDLKGASTVIPITLKYNGTKAFSLYKVNGKKIYLYKAGYSARNPLWGLDDNHRVCVDFYNLKEIFTAKCLILLWPFTRTDYAPKPQIMDAEI